MNCFRYLYIIILITSFLLPYQGFSQKAKTRAADPYGQISLFLGGGVAYYMGDISANFGSGNLGLGPAFSLGGAYRLTEHFSARGEIRLYKVSGDSQYTDHPQKNLSFFTTNPDLMLSVQADLLPYSRRALINPYALLGVGVTYLNPKAEWQGETYSLPPLQTEGYKYWRLPLFISGGIGAMVRINSSWSAGLELTGNFLLSDYLDDVSTVYPEYDQLVSDLAYQLSYRGNINQQPGYVRGNPKSNDMYIMPLVKVAYSIPNPRYARERKVTKCP